MKILVINAGSSSMKFQLMDPDAKKVYGKGNVERIADSGSFLRFKANGKDTVIEKEITNHTQAMSLVIETLLDKNIGVISSIDEIDAFGHRVVNVGEQYFDSCIVTKEVLDDFRAKSEFSPLHMPGAIAGMEGAMAVSPSTPNVAVFDIGFHKTLEEKVFRYPLPNKYYNDYKIRRYGAHGTSHYYVSRQAAEFLNLDLEKVNMVTCHIGSGASITAVKGGNSVDTSMGMTPLEGIMMNTRTGDIDPAVVEFICKKENKTVSEVINIFNKQSGILGIADGISDMRDILKNMDKPNVKLAFDMSCYRVTKYIGAYAAAMGGVDVIVFTAGIGEYTPEFREQVCQSLEFMGVKVDKDKNYNAARGENFEISADDSRVKVVIIPTDEEQVIASQTESLIKK